MNQLEKSEKSNIVTDFSVMNLAHPIRNNFSQKSGYFPGLNFELLPKKIN